MVAHLWANRSQDSARRQDGRFYFTGPAIYSFGSHYVIARHIDLKDGAAILWNTRGYSPSTSKHTYTVSRALSGAQSRDTLNVYGMDSNAIHGRDWMIALAVRVADDAAECYAKAAATVRASRKRDTLAATGADYCNTARRLAETVAAKAGEAEHADAAQRRRARSLLATLAQVPAYPDDTTQQRDACRVAASLLGLERIKRELQQAADKADRAAASAEYNRDCGNHCTALEYANSAAMLAGKAREMAKAYKLRAPKLPDAARLVAALQPAAAVEAREKIAKRARGALKLAELNARKTGRDPYYAERHADDFASYAKRADEMSVPDVVPAWMRERAATLRTRARRTQEVSAAVDSVDAAPVELADAEARAKAHGARDAVNRLTGTIRGLVKACEVLPATHPARAQAFERLTTCTARRDAWRAEFAAEDAAALKAWRAGGSLPCVLRGDSPRLRL
jgi:hypothetical protein